MELRERNSYDSSQPHKHEYMEMFLFKKGGGSHAIDFNNHSIQDYSVHFVFPNQIHKVSRELDTNGHVLLISKAYFADVDYDLFVRFFHSFYLQPALQMESTVFQDVEQLLEAIKSELTTHKAFYQDIVKDYVRVLLKSFLREKSKNNVANIESHVHFNQYMDLLILVEDNFSKHLPVSYYAESLKVSVKKLNAICKEFNTATCSNLIHNRIILEAKKLLLYSEMSVKEVMFALNYSDPAYFNRFFKSKTGQTPTAYKLVYAEKYHS